MSGLVQCDKWLQTCAGVDDGRRFGGLRCLKYSASRTPLARSLGRQPFGVAGDLEMAGSSISQNFGQVCLFRLAEFSEDKQYPVLLRNRCGQSLIAKNRMIPALGMGQPLSRC